MSFTVSKIGFKGLDKTLMVMLKERKSSLKMSSGPEAKMLNLLKGFLVTFRFC